MAVRIHILAWALALVLICAPGARASQADLESQAQRLAAAQIAKMGPAYTAKIDAPRRLVYISALDEATLQETMSRLAAYTDIQRKTLLDSPLPWNVTLVLPTASDYKKLAPQPDIAGFYDPNNRTLTSIDRGRVLIHEFTHALHHAEMVSLNQVHPIWVCEGFATLFESSRIENAGLAIGTDARLAGLLRGLRDKKLLPLETLLKMDTKAFAENATLAYAQSRYLMFYLHSKGLLAKWYTLFKETYHEDATGIAALEKILQSRLPQIEEDWLAWVKTLQVEQATTGRGRLGLEVREDEQGLRVVSLLEGGAAKNSGRIEANDILITINGRAVPNLATYVSAMNSCGANQTIEITLLRQGRSLTIQQPLTGR